MRVEDRERAIREILDNESVSDQQSLVSFLASKYEIEVTQTIVSRDLKRMGVIKRTEGKKRVYANREKEPREEILREAVLSVEFNEVQIVVTTLAGLAPYVGDQLDRSDLDILGCLAGENVVFVSPRSINNIEEISEKIKKHLSCD